MACNSVAILSSPAAARKADIGREPNGLIRRSQSANDLRSGAVLRRSYSDNHISCSMNRTRAPSTWPKLKYSRSAGALPYPISASIIPNSLRSFLYDPETSKDMSLGEGDDVDVVAEENCQETMDEPEKEIKRANWVERLLEVRSHWSKRQQMKGGDGNAAFVLDEAGDQCGGANDGDDEGGCGVVYSSDEEDGEAEYDRESFSKFLDKVPLPDTKQFSQLAFLSNIAYVIPTIRAEDLRRIFGLRFVTSSIEKKAEAAAIKAKFDQDSTRVPAPAETANDSGSEKADQKRRIHPSVAYDIAASAASYVQSRAKNFLSLGHEKQLEGDESDPCRVGDQTDEEGRKSPCMYKSEVAAKMAASTMTAMVAAGEKEKQEAAQDLQSLHSSPCEWFICDDLSTYTRYFVIQGSDSLASWQANLLFEPTRFEETEGIVHRGIYEAAKGIYDQFLPEIISHMDKYGVRAKFQFAGHSLGGSLALLVNLMLLTRKVVTPYNLRPVVTFGSPFILCGGEKILNQLGVDENIIHCVIMHRDIVPRAFSCSYPGQVAVLLKRLNGSFRSHPCLNRNKLLYSPMGKLFILQPDEKTSPPHPLLPSGSALYALDKEKCGFSPKAVRAFINRPHPLDTLSDPSAYGSEGAILRDHDSSNYLKALNGVLREQRKLKMVMNRAGRQSNQLWPLLASPSPHSWSHEKNFDIVQFKTTEVTTGV
ncbi:phospholipase A1 PLIP1, chloroplastic [Punica granatum]|uniref:Fungal lipase-type domain-containing protein n=2 Tax=Punica granatum TaxID=22663 RepID=A0A218W8L4_PUNGR|nr:phospholipase A1 PLIP1, chloroplastic [Punica granatum]XP_031376634.1 phospholipase A1 PLIP1, chloroplastic [Punica granatum]XP_031376640.1 phospholipase A1 PLIP1, chloroplastic [Punica granatum]XP_031376648.1 phospholipase A1 PLIP1, chloroplastic [Punica granatum]XP_031376656.1 phospholipase A1 PLIP1, chloroplastic [Punica granatum]XP_031376665.1 phospholipase A1 PLIP1, chloroplastic [Punica granatum]XP_031376673.1 phospholipase A1 PLIP1, chloroplastic [Punica granatum]OWM68660.1 hypothe